MEKAVKVLSQGFSNFGASCPYRRHPSITSFTSENLKIDFGRFQCTISLIGQSTGLFGFNFGSRSIALPSALKTAATLGSELGSCMKQGFQLFRCISDKATDMMSWASVKKIGGWMLNPAKGFPSLATVAKLGGELASCTQTGTGILSCLSDKATNVMSWGSVEKIGGWVINPTRGVPSLATAATLGSELASCMKEGFQLFRCISDKATGMMSWGSVEKIGGWVINPTHGVPSLATVAKLGVELASCTQTGTGILSCLSDKATNVMSWGSVEKIGGWVINPTHGVPSLATVAKLGGELASCTQTGTGILSCLSDKATNVMSWGSVDKIGGWVINPTHGVPSLATVAKLGGELASCTQTGWGLMRCLSDKTTNVMSWSSVNTIGDWIINPAHGVPSLATVAKLGGELASCTQTGPGIMGCLSDKTTNVMSWKSVNTIGGWVINPTHGVPSLATVATLGGELASCTQTGSGLMRCLSDKTTDIMSWGSVGKIGNWVINPTHGVAPLSHLNRVGDILADLLEGFGKVAASVAGQVLSGGSSLIQEAALSRRVRLGGRTRRSLRYASSFRCQVPGCRGCTRGASLRVKSRDHHPCARASAEDVNPSNGGGR